MEEDHNIDSDESAIDSDIGSFGVNEDNRNLSEDPEDRYGRERDISSRGDLSILDKVASEKSINDEQVSIDKSTSKSVGLKIKKRKSYAKNEGEINYDNIDSNIDTDEDSMFGLTEEEKNIILYLKSRNKEDYNTTLFFQENDEYFDRSEILNKSKYNLSPLNEENVLFLEKATEKYCSRITDKVKSCEKLDKQSNISKKPKRLSVVWNECGDKNEVIDDQYTLRIKLDILRLLERKLLNDTEKLKENESDEVIDDDIDPLDAYMSHNSLVIANSEIKKIDLQLKGVRERISLNQKYLSALKKKSK